MRRSMSFEERVTTISPPYRCLWLLHLPSSGEWRQHLSPVLWRCTYLWCSRSVPRAVAGPIVVLGSFSPPPGTLSEVPSCFLRRDRFAEGWRWLSLMEGVVIQLIHWDKLSQKSDKMHFNWRPCPRFPLAPQCLHFPSLYRCMPSHGVLPVPRLGLCASATCRGWSVERWRN